MPLGGHIRLCKGAYVEPESVAFTSTAEVDAAFARLLNVLMGYEERDAGGRHPRSQI